METTTTPSTPVKSDNQDQPAHTEPGDLKGQLRLHLQPESFRAGPPSPDNSPSDSNDPAEVQNYHTTVLYHAPTSKGLL